jgi:translation initiation factor IF-3
MLVDEETGQNHIVATDDAQARAVAAGLDLVLVAPHANPPVARIMDFGKYRYEQDRAARKQKQTRKAQELKEIRLTARMEGHDLEQRAKRAQEFLAEGHRLHLSVRFRGRENLFRDRGITLMKKFAEEVGQQFETPPRVAGNTVSVNLIPKPKSDVTD